MGTRTKTGEMGQLGRIIRHRTHKPVRGCLPHGIENATEDIQEDLASVSRVENIHPLRCERHAGTGVCPE
jgi:hypothetical protein